MKLSEWAELERKQREAGHGYERLSTAADAIRERLAANPDMTPEQVADVLMEEAREQIAEVERIGDILLEEARKPVRWSAQELEALRIFGEQAPTWRRRESDVSDVYVWLEGEPGAATLGLIFKHRDHPGCVFGFRMPLAATTLNEDGSIDHPESAVNVTWANIDEEIDASDYGLPTNAKPGEVTWI
jgi:hypothetical protein